MDNSLNAGIGERIRLERESRGWSLSELAARARVSRAMVYKVEQAISSPTAHTLGKLAGAFGLSMSTLIARAEIAQGRLLRLSEQPLWIDPDTGYQRRHVSPRGASSLDVVHINLPAGRSVAMPAAAYAFQHQLLWVLEGELLFQEGSVRHRLLEGDCLELGPPMNCLFKNETRHDCRYAVMLTPSSSHVSAPDTTRRRLIPEIRPD